MSFYSEEEEHGKKQGILEACESMHQFCLKEGMDCEEEEQRAYTRMIIFLNNKFGHLR
ncbi:MAG TPA: hypothetical protein VKN74_02645 [Candidatus Mcinerneyibacterium sp.]|nr:hypothetical protein [Candidatus Mcinerneyibacterium sp.]